MSTINVQLDNKKDQPFRPRILVFGVGGAGGNAINNMINSNLEGVEFVAANTDKQALELSKAQYKLQLGTKTTSGLGAGTVPQIGKASAEESIEEIEKYLEGANMLFITAGMGGGTGTGASPVIARIAKEKGILTIGIITKPFEFEGNSRVEIGDTGIEELRQYVDTLMVVSNQNLFKISNINTGFSDAFNEADNVLHNSVRSITDLITAPGLINLDFADVKTVIKKMGEAVMGIGEASGENRVIKALEDAVSNPLLNNASIEGAKGVIVNISGGSDMTMFEVEEAMALIQEEVDPKANIILGTALNEALEGKLRISIVATGINTDDSQVYPDYSDSPLEKFAKEQEYAQYKRDISRRYSEDFFGDYKKDSKSNMSVNFNNSAEEDEDYEGLENEQTAEGNVYVEQDISIEETKDGIKISEVDIAFSEPALESEEENEDYLDEEEERITQAESSKQKRESIDSLYTKNLTAEMKDFFNPTETINPDEEGPRYGRRLSNNKVEVGIKKYNFSQENSEEQSDIRTPKFRSFEKDLDLNSPLSFDDSENNDLQDESLQGLEEKESAQEEEIKEQKPKKEGRTLFGSIFKRGGDSSKNKYEKEAKKDTGIKIHSEDGNVKLDTLDNFNSDVEVNNDISDVPAYLRKK